jgi:hypothetical protein
LAKSPKVIGVLVEPSPPTWWKANRHWVYLAAGALLGYLVWGHPGATPAGQPGVPTPGHSAPTTPGPSRTHTTLGLAA